MESSREPGERWAERDGRLMGNEVFTSRLSLEDLRSILTALPANCLPHHQRFELHSTNVVAISLPKGLIVLANELFDLIGLVRCL